MELLRKKSPESALTSMARLCVSAVIVARTTSVAGANATVGDVWRLTGSGAPAPRGSVPASIRIPTKPVRIASPSTSPPAGVVQVEDHRNAREISAVNEVG